jgi:hypothetical protein
VTVTVPALIPVIAPVSELITAVVVLLLNQLPPVGLPVSTIADAVQTEPAPPMAVGKVFTVNAAVFIQPGVAVYVITGVPVATPVTTPVAPSTVASAVLLLLHVPPAAV